MMDIVICPQCGAVIYKMLFFDHITVCDSKLKRHGRKIIRY